MLVPSAISSAQAVVEIVVHLLDELVVGKGRQIQIVVAHVIPGECDVFHDADQVRIAEL